MSRERDAREGERGQIIVVFTIVLIVILGFTALVVDLGILRNDRQTLANAMDAGALAGGTLLPINGSDPANPTAFDDITSIIEESVDGTYPGLSNPGDYEIAFKCLIGVDAGMVGIFEAADIEAYIPLDCDPRPSMGLSDATLPGVGAFSGAGKTRTVDCFPEQGDKCNVVIVDGNVSTPFTFGRVVGVNSGNTGTVTSASCRGLCGELPIADFDVMLVIDDSSSMGGNRSAGQTRSYWAKKAATELMDSLQAARGTQRVGAVKYSGQWDAATAAVVLSPLTTDFLAVKAAIAPLVGNGGNTPLKQGMALGASTLTAQARPASAQVLVFVSDGRANPDTTTTARPTAAEVTTFRASADQVYSVAIGAGGTGANNPDIPLMTSLAKPADGTHFFHVVDADNLPDVFRQIVTDLLNPHAHLIQVYPPPQVTAVGGSSTVAISGKYFTGATKVTFGGAQVPYMVNSDTSITATAPSGPSGQTVHVQVTTPGGSSPRISADQYTFP